MKKKGLLLCLLVSAVAAFSATTDGVAVDFGGSYSSVNINSTWAETWKNGDFDLDGNADDRTSIVPFGSEFTPPNSANWTVLPGKSNGKIYQGFNVAVLDDTATSPQLAMSRIASNSRIQMGNTKLADKQLSQAFALYWVAAGFVNGTPAPLINTNSSLSVTLASGGSKPAVRFLVRAQQSGKWYVSADSSTGSFSINGAAADWVEFDPTDDILFVDASALTNSVKGSELGNISAAGVYGQAQNYSGATGSLFGMDALKILVVPTEAPSMVSSNGYFEHLPSGEIDQIRADLNVQKKLYFIRQTGDILDPRPVDPDWDPSRGIFTRYWNQDICTFAMKSFQLEETLAEANQSLTNMCQFHLDDPLTFYEVHSFPGIFDALVTMCLKFGPNGIQLPGLLTQNTYDKITETMFEWSKVKSKISDTEKELSQTWDIFESENHHAQHWYGCWAFSRLLKDDPIYGSQTYDDGFTPQEHYEAWSAYLIEYFRQRIQKGMLIEINSSSYAATTLKCVLGVYDYSDNETLRQRASDFLDVYWTLWAQSEVDGVCAGAKTRCYPSGNERGADFLFRGAWYLIGIGEALYEHISMFPFVTTDWIPPDLVFDLVYSPSGRATYESFERRMGLARAARIVQDDGSFLYRANYDYGGLIRYLWRTPEFTMSSLLFDALPNEEWTSINSQNRWWGVVFKGHPDARIYPFCNSGDTAYNADWAVQAQGTMISQELLAAQNSLGYRVWFSTNGLTAPVESGGWIFAEAERAYAAVKVVGSAYTWDSNANGSWIEITTRYSPVIIEAAPANEYASFDAFKSAIQTLSPDTSIPGQLHYRGLNGDEFVFYTDQAARNQINGKPIDLAPVKTYRSPFIESSEDGGVVTLRCFDRSETISLGDVPFYDTTATFALWHFNEESSSGVFPDTSSAAGTEADAAVHSDSTNTVSLINDGKFGKAIRCEFLDGNQYLMTVSSLWPTDQGTFRYQGWFRLGDGDTGGYLFHMYDQVYVSVSTTTASFMINKSGVGADTSATNRVSISAELLATNGWQYIDAFYDGETIRLTTSSETVLGAGLGLFVPNRRNMQVGSRKNANNFVGDMDEVRISIPALQTVAAEPNDPFDSDGDGMPDPWEEQYFGSHRGGTSVSDADSDGFLDVDEFRAGTSPLDSASLLKLNGIVPEGSAGELNIFWQSVDGKTYRILSATNLLDGIWTTNVTGVSGTAPENSRAVSVDGAAGFFKIETE
jgi:hypothetical protein